MTQPYQRVSAPRTRFTSNFPFSAGGLRITSGSAFSQARPRAWREEGREGRREGGENKERDSVVDGGSTSGVHVCQQLKRLRGHPKGGTERGTERGRE